MNVGQQRAACRRSGHNARCRRRRASWAIATSSARNRRNRSSRRSRRRRPDRARAARSPRRPQQSACSRGVRSPLSRRRSAAVRATNQRCSRDDDRYPADPAHEIDDALVPLPRAGGIESLAQPLVEPAEHGEPHGEQDQRRQLESVRWPQHPAHRRGNQAADDRPRTAAMRNHRARAASRQAAVRSRSSSPPSIRARRRRARGSPDSARPISARASSPRSRWGSTRRARSAPAAASRAPRRRPRARCPRP